MTQRRLDQLQIVDASYVGGVGVSMSGGRDEAATGWQRLPPPTSAEVAFAGRSNVGKSSLINTLLERRGLVRTSSTPGSTRQINIFEARARDGAAFRLVDLPGYGFTRRSKAEQALWASLIEGYLGERVTLAAVVLLVDARRGLLPDDLELIHFIEAARDAVRRPVQVILVATKIDKLASSQRRSVLDRLARAAAVPAQQTPSLTKKQAKGAQPPAEPPPERPAQPGPKRTIIGFSSITGEGRTELWRAIRRASLGTEAVTPPAPQAPAPPAPAPPSDPEHQP